MRVCWCPFDTRWMGWHSRSLSFGYFSKTLVKGSRFSSMALGVQVTRPHGFFPPRRLPEGSPRGGPYLWRNR